jgi:hypothetical protein
MKSLKNGIKKIAVKVDSHTGAIYKALIKSLSGSKEIQVEPGLMVYLLPDGTLLELYGPGAAYPVYLFERSDTVVSIQVDNLGITLAELEKNGGQLIGDVEHVCSSYRYCYVYMNEKSVLGIFELS